MADNKKQRFRAKPQIQASDIADADLLIMEHLPTTDKDADKSLRMDEAKKYFNEGLNPVDTVQSGNMNPVTSNAVNGALADYKYSTYTVKANDAPPLISLNWASNYYAQLPIPDNVTEIISCLICGFSQTNNGLKYQLAIGQDKKSLYVCKVNSSDIILPDEKIGYLINYR